MLLLWDYLRAPSRNEMQAWADKKRLGTRERAQLNQKLDLLERVGFDTAWNLGFVAGTSGEHNHIYKVVVKSQRMLRPMFCRGPVDKHGEATLLCGAIEKDNELDPPDAAGRADERRQDLIEKIRKREEGRVPHERF